MSKLPTTKLSKSLDLSKLQRDVSEWRFKNFGITPTYYPLLGVVEEIGELAHAYLKQAQGIRKDENFEEHIKDAIGDTVIFLMDLCDKLGYDLKEIIQDTWKDVKKRNWKKYPINGIDK